MATTPAPLYVKRAKTTLTDGMVVTLTCAVQMFYFSRAGKPVFGQLLPKGTKVTLLVPESQAVLAKGFKFYCVEQNGHEGYIPKAAFHDFVHASMGTQFTGVTYGGDKWTTDGKDNLYAFPIDDDGFQPCFLCGAKVNDHKLYETHDLAALVTKLIGLLNISWDKRTFRHDRFMIGGLRTRQGSLIFSYSGTLGAKDLAEFEKRAGEVDGAAIVAPPISGRTFERDFDRTVKYPTDMSSWSCAAPRAVQAAWNKSELPEFLSEKWFGSTMGVAIEGHSVKSCDNCRKNLSFMLCGLAFDRL